VRCAGKHDAKRFQCEPVTENVSLYRRPNETFLSYAQMQNILDSTVLNINFFGI
jgi:hypothetical protein